ncbi:MAG: hypothetical protein K9W46_02250 [Candidatus Heimdallarchaeum endolithica]|uniref:Uncharacterized protein n=1 Tax=Candidatus Heimdallarchaeum endolithica TaxID=2876572 RepID=A0A9Y1BTE4_9ARCH|nr:MAG: hypothetical protein K9W46_02250 [Candidatus Heimdallarchaeum endolithica]
MKKKYFSFFIIAIFIASILNSVSILAETAPDELELKEGTYVKGRYYTDADNETISTITLSVTKIWNITNSLDVIAIEQKMEYPSGSTDIFFGSTYSTIIMTELVWKHNRTVIYPAAKLKLVNSSDTIEATILDNPDYESMMDVDNLKVVLKDGTSYRIGEIDNSNPDYSKVIGMAFAWAIINAMLIIGYTYTWLAISPDTEDTQTVNYRNGTASVEDISSFTVGGKKYSTVHLQQSKKKVTSGIFSNYFNEVDAYYETKTGFLIKWKEKDYDTDELYIFEPSEIEIKASLIGNIDFSIYGALVAFAVLSFAVVARKKK